MWRIKYLLEWASLELWMLWKNVSWLLRGLGRVTLCSGRHLWESWMSVKERRTRRKIVDTKVSREVSKAVIRLFSTNQITLWELNKIAEKFAAIGIYDIGFIDEKSYGKPWWAPGRRMKQLHLKQEVVGRLMTAQTIMGKDYEGLSVPEIYVKLAQQKGEKRTTKRRLPKIVLKSA